MAGPLKSFFNKAGEVASTVGGAVKDAASIVVDKVDDQIENMKGGKIKVPVSVVGDVVVIDSAGTQFLEIDPAEYEKV